MCKRWGGGFLARRDWVKRFLAHHEGGGAQAIFGTPFGNFTLHPRLVIIIAQPFSLHRILPNQVHDVTLLIYTWCYDRLVYNSGNGNAHRYKNTSQVPVSSAFHGIKNRWFFKITHPNRKYKYIHYMHIIPVPKKSAFVEHKCLKPWQTKPVYSKHCEYSESV